MENKSKKIEEAELNTQDTQDVEATTDTQDTKSVEGESGLVMELRDYAQQIGMNPTDKKFREIAVDYIQKKAVGILDEKAGPSRRLLDNKENAEKYQGMLDETFSAFNYNDAESDDFRRHAIDPDQLKPLDDKYYRNSKEFAEIQQEYRNVHATSTADKAAAIYKRFFDGDENVKDSGQEYAGERVTEEEQLGQDSDQLRQEEQIRELKRQADALDREIDREKLLTTGALAASAGAVLVTAFGLLAMTGAGSSTVVPLDQIGLITDRVVELNEAGYESWQIVEAIKSWMDKGMESGKDIIDFITTFLGDGNEVIDKVEPINGGEGVTPDEAVVPGGEGVTPDEAAAAETARILAESAEKANTLNNSVGAPAYNGSEEVKEAIQDGRKFYGPEHNWNTPS